MLRPPFERYLFLVLRHSSSSFYFESEHAPKTTNAQVEEEYPSRDQWYLCIKHIAHQLKLAEATKGSDQPSRFQVSHLDWVWYHTC